MNTQSKGVNGAEIKLLAEMKESNFPAGMGISGGVWK